MPAVAARPGSGHGLDTGQAGGGGGVDPHSLKQRVDTLYHRILKAEVDARLQAEIDKREGLERELHQRAARATARRSSPPAATGTTATTVGSKSSTATATSGGGGRENAFEAVRHAPSARSSNGSGGGGGVGRGGGNAPSASGSSSSSSASSSVPIVRQFRHKHEIVRDAEVAQRRVVEARERLALERKKCAAVDAEHAEVTKAVHASKKKIKDLITLIRSLALSRTHKMQQQEANPRGGFGGEHHSGDEEGGKDAAQIIDDHLDTILDLLPQYERKAQRMRSVVYNSLDGGGGGRGGGGLQRGAGGRVPSTIDDVRSRSPLIDRISALWVAQFVLITACVRACCVRCVHSVRFSNGRLLLSRRRPAPSALDPRVLICHAVVSPPHRTTPDAVAPFLLLCAVT
jgi:hypothetical protein